MIQISSNMGRMKYLLDGGGIFFKRQNNISGCAGHMERLSIFIFIFQVKIIDNICIHQNREVGIYGVSFIECK